MIRRLLLFLLILSTVFSVTVIAFSGIAYGQGPATVTLTAFRLKLGAGGATVPDGSKLCVMTTDTNDRPAGYRLGSGYGQTSASADYQDCRTIAGGAISSPLTVINSAASSTQNACIRVTLKAPNDAEIRRDKCFQTGTTQSLASGGWCTTNPDSSITCNYDSYPVGNAPNPLVLKGPMGNQGDPGCMVGDSSCDGVMRKAPTNTQTIVQPSGTTNALVQGTPINPGLGLSFATPTDSYAVDDESAQTTDFASQGNPFFAPIHKTIGTQRGSADMVTHYDELDCMPGSTGDCYGPFSAVIATPGSRPPQIANNRLVIANNFIGIQNCSTTSGLSTCNLVIPTYGASVNPFRPGDAVYISGVGAPYDTTASPYVWTISSVTASTVTFSGIAGNVGPTGSCDTTNVISACPHISGASDIFGYEDEVINNSHDPGSELDNPRIRQVHDRVRGHLVTCGVGKYRCSHGILIDTWNYLGVDVQDSVDADFYAGNLPALFAAPTTPLQTRFGYLAGARLADPNAGQNANVNSSLPFAWEYYKSLGFGVEQHFYKCIAVGQGFAVLARLTCYHDGVEVFSVGPDGDFRASSLTLNSVHVPTVTSGGIITTASGSDVVSLPGFPGSGQCTATAQNVAAAAAANPFISGKLPGQVTLNHVATAGMGYDVVCITP